MKNFEGFGLSQDLNKSLAKMDYKSPTPIQAKAIPLALDGHDVLGSAQTGTGKTAAFSIPLVEALLRSPHGTALVMTPTRELAKQVLEVIHQLLGHKSHIKTAFIIGGASMDKQYKQLRNNPRIIVGTPGRINDHLERGSLSLSDTGFLVLDETDRMLDMGFGVQLDKIVRYLPQERQTLMFSATMPKEIVKLSSKYLNNPQRVSVGATNVVATKIKQEIIRVEQTDKYKELTRQLDERQGSVIVFIKTKHHADRMAKNLRRDGFTSDALHGDLRQNKRDKVMRNFREQNFRILVATDIAARGLDVPHIEHVINHDLPQVAEDYIHRMGRTARAGAEGSAISFVSSQDSRKWHAIEKLLDPSKTSSQDNLPDAPRRKKSRKKPYHGRPAGKRPENNQKNNQDDNRGNTSENKENFKHKKSTPRSDAYKKKKRSDQQRSDKPREEGSYFDKPRSNKPKSFKGKPHAKKRDENKGGNAPMKRRGNSNKPSGFKGKSKHRGGNAPRKAA